MCVCVLVSGVNGYMFWWGGCWWLWWTGVCFSGVDGRVLVGVVGGWETYVMR